MRNFKLIKNKIFKNYLILMSSLFLIELITRIILKLDLIDWAILRIFIGINIISLFFSMLISLVPNKITNILNLVVVFAVEVYALAQIGFSNFMGTFMSVNSSSQLGKVASYFKDYIQTFSWQYYLVLIPFILLILYYLFLNKKIKIFFDYKHYLNYIISIVLLIILCFMFYESLTVKFMQNKYQIETNKNLFKYSEIPNITFNQFGASIYAIIDLKSLLGEANTNTIINNNDNKNNPVTDYTRIIDDTSWNEVIKNETNKNYQNLNEYFINKDITDKNEMTGYFKDKNLIVILLESVNTIPFIYPEYFPNLNKLYNEGWTWTNNYSPRNSCSTGNNEMTVMTSLYTINNSCTANTYKNNSYFEAIFNLFNNVGYNTSSYHDYGDFYYYRKTIHPNMGSGHYYNAYNLGIKVNSLYEEWPSDVELFENSFEHYANNDKFMAFIDTVTTHRPYTVSSEYGDKHLDLFKDLDISKTGKRYLSKMKELDEGLGVLINKLTLAGELDDTVIVLFADHYPYGLSNNQLQEFFDYKVTENYERDRTPLVIYNSTLTPTKYEDYTTFINILPTIANLFDLNYDPRYYMGVDLFSDDYKSMAIFSDGSWQTNNAFYNASSGKISYKDNTITMSDTEIIEINKKISNDIKMSNLAITKNYFAYLNNALNKYKITIPTIEETTDEINSGS